mmetsp:Transcript_21042/g.43048  ORF Transcript_21042/g.43048 Transcript_21042/m.43048 type:complete len:177 (-) Transcript_21042:27-557(-)
MLLVLKLFFLGVRQISKPIANRAKDAAHNSGLLKAVAVGLGRGMNRLQTQVTRLSEGRPPLLKVTPLEEEEAVTKGAETLSEMIIYSVAGATVAYEYNLTQKDKKRKEAAEYEKEMARREAIRLNEERQWAEFTELRTRITLMEEQLWTLRKAHAEGSAGSAQAQAGGSGWRNWFR